MSIAWCYFGKEFTHNIIIIREHTLCSSATFKRISFTRQGNQLFRKAANFMRTSFCSYEVTMLNQSKYLIA